AQFPKGDDPGYHEGKDDSLEHRERHRPQQPEGDAPVADEEVLAGQDGHQIAGCPQTGDEAREPPGLRRQLAAAPSRAAAPAPAAPRLPAHPEPAGQADPDGQPDPPEGARSLVVVVFDSLRYDAALAAGMPNAGRLGPLERRWSYASWTAPSHYNLLMGLLPHSSPRHVYASEYYKRDFLKYNERLGTQQVEFKSLVPHLFLPTFLKQQLGYQTHALVSLPLLHPATPP